MIGLLPISEYDLWVREMTISGLDFKNPVGIETFNCFKKICVIERNTCESSRIDPALVEVQSSGVKKPVKSSHKVQIQDRDYLDTEPEVGIHATLVPTPRSTWNPPAGLKFPCPVGNHKHEVSTCPDFFNFSPMDRWEKIEKRRMCYSCLKPKNICKSRKCENIKSIPEILKCAVCATWAEPRGLAPFSIFFCKNKLHSSSMTPLPDLKAELEKYLRKLGTTVVDSKIRFSVNFIRKKRRSRAKKSRENNQTKDNLDKYY